METYDLTEYGQPMAGQVVVNRIDEVVSVLADVRASARTCQQALIDFLTDDELAPLWACRQRLNGIPAQRSPLPVKAQVQAWLDSLTDEGCEVAWQQRCLLFAEELATAS